jgi:hypothetical protein
MPGDGVYYSKPPENSPGSTGEKPPGGGENSKPEDNKPGEEISKPGAEAPEEPEKPKNTKPEVPPEVMAALEKELLERDLVVDGKIPPEKGQEAVDLIRERLRPYSSDINGRNIAFAVVEVNGESHIVIGISGDNPGAPIPENPEFTAKPQGYMDRKVHSEFKIMEQIYKELQGESKDSDIRVAVYTEQKPCPSCEPVIKQEFPDKLKDDGFSDVTVSDPTFTFQNEGERLAHNRPKRVRKK